MAAQNTGPLPPPPTPHPPPPPRHTHTTHPPPTPHARSFSSPGELPNHMAAYITGFVPISSIPYRIGTANVISASICAEYVNRPITLPLPSSTAPPPLR